MAHQFTLARRVEFSDTDMAGIMHFANFFRFMEATEHEYFRSLGLKLHHGPESAAAKGGAMSGWARVRADCEYLEPLLYSDLVEVGLTVVEKGASTLTYAFEFHTPAERGARLAARGSLKVVHVTRGAEGDRMRASMMPEEVSALVHPAATVE